MTAQPSKPAYVWLPPGTPAAIADAVRRAGGELVAPEAANVLLLYGYPSPSADDVPLLRSLLTDSVEWVQLQPAGVEDWFARGLVDDQRVWTSSAGAYAVAVAEHVLALLLASAKRLVECARADTWRHADLQGVPLSGSTVGIVGAGGIGREIIRRLEPLDVRVIASTHSGSAVKGAARSLGAGDLDELLTESDYVVLCAPLTPETRGLIGARELDLIGPRGALINVARGALVDTGAVVAALRDGRLGGAFLDVTEPEPLPSGHPLWSEPRALVTPHVANTRQQLEAALLRRVEQNVARFRAGEPLLGVIDPAAGY
ncbi:MAG TPA: NAD(P)-dependent oxidoreductase [Gaiellales bacterium]|nr:NAD(P)-dependent oxidoreductase [Gaiellales bacterium]